MDPIDLAAAVTPVGAAPVVILIVSIIRTFAPDLTVATIRKLALATGLVLVAAVTVSLEGWQFLLPGALNGGLAGFAAIKLFETAKHGLGHDVDP